jgi:ATP-dependent exoDNAse (exonuclease V) alpha subunit
MRHARAEKRIRRRKWNSAAARQHYKDGKYQLLKCPCEDRKKGGESLSRAEQLAMLKRKFEVKARSDDRAPLEDEILLAKGMKVMLVSNIQTDFDMANGARGTVQDIILDEREADCQESAFERKLQFPPACVLVKLDRMRVHHFGSLSENVVPVFPAESKIRLQLSTKTVTVTRRQLPLTPAYAFTDYRAQGQTLERVIVDLGRPPTGKLTPFNAYVALSRSSGRETIKLLRDFDEELFVTVPSETLEKEDIRLQKLANETSAEFEKSSSYVVQVGR